MVKFVTTMAQKDVLKMGAQLFDSWDKHSKKDKLLVFVDYPEEIENKWKNVLFYKIDNNDYYAFLKRNTNKQNTGILPNGRYEYRLDVVKFSHKVYAQLEGLKYLDDKDGLYIWWDADAQLTEDISEQKIKNILGPMDWAIAYLGRKDWDHSETGFIAYNLKNESAKEFIKDMANIYTSDQILMLANGRSDSHVFDLVRDSYTKFKQVTFKNLSEDVPGNDVWEHTVLSKFSKHFKGFASKADQGILSDIKTEIVSEEEMKKRENVRENVSKANDFNDIVRTGSRYDQLFKLIKLTKPSVIVEIGVAQGLRAMEMAKEALKHNDICVYMGFDLFDDITPEISAEEMNAKTVGTMEEISNRLREFAEKHPGFYFTLFKGNTRETLKEYLNETIELTNQEGLIVNTKPSLAEFVFIDGGHSIETINNDYSAFKHCPIVVLDDFYVPDQQGRCVDVTKFGCNHLVAELLKNGETAKILPMKDGVVTGGLVQMALVGAKAKDVDDNFIKNILGNSGLPKQQNTQSQPNQNTKSRDLGGIKIETRNSIPNEVLQSQVDYACRMMKKYNITEPQFCELHDHWAYMVGGSESYKKPEFLDQIERAAALKEDYVFTSKTAHDYLISQNIIPWACILLDPRPHVADYFNPHPDVLYFVASQCHPAVFDKLIDFKAKIQVYHAEVAAGERDVVKKHFPNGTMIQGGSTSQSRGMSVLMNMGFYKFKLFGLDSSYPEKPEKVHGINQEKKPMEITVTYKNDPTKLIGKGKYWTDPELLAQINDMEYMTKLFRHAIFDCQSEGLLKDMMEHWITVKKNKFDDVYKNFHNTLIEEVEND